MEEKLIIDVSHWNTVDMEMLVKHQPQVVGCMIKIGQMRLGKWSEDVKFRKYYDAAKAAGLKVGCYWFSTAKNEKEAEVEVNAALDAMKGLVFELPVAGDYEGSYHVGKVLNQVVALQGEAVEEKGGFFAAYMNASVYSQLNEENVQKYSVWIAHWNPKADYRDVKGIVMHQFTSTFQAIGASAPVDMSYLHYDVARVIEERGLNRFLEEPGELEMCKECPYRNQKEV